jgi:hypothetical protein
VDRLLSLAMRKTETKDVLSRLYYGFGRASAYSCGDKLRAAAASDQGHTVSRSDVREFLESQDAYTVQRPVRKSFLVMYTT